MGFSYNDIPSKSMGLKARLTSWQVCGGMRNFTTTVPGKYGVTDFGADFDYREINVACNIYPKHSFSALVSTLDELSTWLVWIFLITTIAHFEPIGSVDTVHSFCLFGRCSRPNMPVW